MSDFMKRKYHLYVQTILKNPSLATDSESLLKWTSLLISGFSSSYLLSEVVYAASNLLVLLNDSLISSLGKRGGEDSSKTLKIWLSILEYCEVTFELSALQFWGARGKWTAAALIQLLKCVGRLYLILRHRQGLLPSPPLQSFNRANSPSHEELYYPVIKLTSGKYVSLAPRPDERQVENILKRTRMPLYGEAQYSFLYNRSYTFAEILYIVKPICHLGVAYFSGMKSWKPWTLTLLMDLLSMKLFFQDAQLKQLSQDQRKSLFYRHMNLFLYLLRSPFYDRVTKAIIYFLLEDIFLKLPMFGWILKPCVTCLPKWQKTYFYMWSK